MTRSARAVPKGTVLFTNNGSSIWLARGLWDGNGSFMAGGSDLLACREPARLLGPPLGRPPFEAQTVTIPR